jgi:transcriptional regulator with XRE-family HTH domain
MRQVREEKDLRQIDVALQAGCSLTWIWLLEQGGQERVSREIKERVAEALETTVEELFLEV